jgi:hypothetical protein
VEDTQGFKGVGRDADHGNSISYITHRWGGVGAYCIAVLETEVEILDIELQVWKNELSR